MRSMIFVTDWEAFVWAAFEGFILVLFLAGAVVCDVNE